MHEHAWLRFAAFGGAFLLATTARAQSTGTPLSALTVGPTNPLDRPSQNAGLNTGYDYIGATSAYRPGNRPR